MANEKAKLIPDEKWNTVGVYIIEIRDSSLCPHGAFVEYGLVQHQTPRYQLIMPSNNATGQEALRVLNSQKRELECMMNYRYLYRGSELFDIDQLEQNDQILFQANINPCCLYCLIL